MLKNDFYDNDIFKKHSRGYNNLFAFSALGVSSNNSALSKGFSFVKIQGRTYHRIFDIFYTGKVNNISLYINDGEERLRLAENQKLSGVITNQISKYLNEVNPLINSIRQLNIQTNDNAHIVFEQTSRRKHGSVLGDTPIINEIAGILRFDSTADPRKIVIWKNKEEQPRFVHFLDPAYESLQYPLLFPHATVGWSPTLKGPNGDKISQIKYYRHLMLSEPRFMNTRRLGQEYFVDMYSRTEEERLSYIRHNQGKFMRISSRNEIEETIAGEGGIKPGKVYLPSSFTQSPRYMQVKYQDAMAIVSRLGKPTFFLTITCNPHWQEIKDSLSQGETAMDRPDLCNRVSYI